MIFIISLKLKLYAFIFFNSRYELVLECEVDGGYENTTLSWWIDDVRYDNKLDIIINRDADKNKPRKLINRIIYR